MTSWGKALIVGVISVALTSAIYKAFMGTAEASVASMPVGASKDAPKTSLGCGNINPHMIATAYSDVDPNQGFPSKTVTIDSWVPVPEGPHSALASTGAEYTNNGHGSIGMSMDSMCAVLLGTQDSWTVILSFKTQTNAMSGHCCSGWGPGGDGVTAPEWNGQIELPGHDSDDVWDISIMLSTIEKGPSPTCNIQLDLQDKSEPANQEVREAYMLKPGGHLFDVSCKEGRIGSRPGNWDTAAQFNEGMNVFISGARRDKRVANPRIFK